ncbi:MAG: hypothetical protein WC141_07105 [Arcobacteraceae bacterium]
MNNIEINNADRKTINEHKGYIIGFNSDVVAIGNMNIELLNRFKDYFSQAKGILVKFSINKKQNIFEINEVMMQLSDIANNDADIIFGTEINKNIELGKCKFHVDITGIEEV